MLNYLSSSHFQFVVSTGVSYDSQIFSASFDVSLILVIWVTGPLSVWYEHEQVYSFLHPVNVIPASVMDRRITFLIDGEFRDYAFMITTFIELMQFMRNTDAKARDRYWSKIKKAPTGGAFLSNQIELVKFARATTKC
jgi:hypothetical protein